MSQSTAATPRSCLPRSFAGKTGLLVELQRLPEDAGQRLIEMYLAFQPRNSFQGLPPIKDEVCVRWVREMLATGIHVVAQRGAGPWPAATNAGETPALRQTTPALRQTTPALRQTTPALRQTTATIIGHCALFPVNDKKCEMLVVVCPGFQDLGIGTQLVRSSIALADELGFERIWLPVDATNVRARHVYRKCGFEYVSDKQGRELDMICDVPSWRPKAIHDLHGPAPRVPAPCFHFPCLSPLLEGK
jgi:RimJ/RimL family protein N-acetyltransferase